MNKLECLITNFLENNHKGNEIQILKYLIENNYKFEDLLSLKNRISRILERLSKSGRIKFDNTFGEYITKTENMTHFEKDALQNSSMILIATIFRKECAHSGSRLDLNGLNEFLNDSLTQLGNYKCVKLKRDDGILIGIFEFGFTKIDIILRKESLVLRCSSKFPVTSDDPFLKYLLSNKGYVMKIKSLIPQNHGIYLFYNLMIKFLEQNSDFALKINEIIIEDSILF